MNNELLTFDRIEAIKTIINKYGEENFYLSFSGGKDSTILHYLLDMALPDNSIPRLYIDTGIEYNMIRKFVLNLARNDKRIVIIKPEKPIIKTLQEVGYPFKSKEHSTKLHEWQKGNRTAKSIQKYVNDESYSCPKILKYQFTDEFHLKVSQYCCHKLKKEPAKRWAKVNHKSIIITGMRREEGGQRNTLACIVTNNDGKTIKFHPLAPVTDEWENYMGASL